MDLRSFLGNCWRRLDMLPIIPALRWSVGLGVAATAIVTSGVLGAAPAPVIYDPLPTPSVIPVPPVDPSTFVPIPAPGYVIPFGPWGYTFGDFNGDGLLDIVVAPS